MLLPTAPEKPPRFDEKWYSDRSPTSSGRSWLLMKICLAQQAEPARLASAADSDDTRGVCPQGREVQLRPHRLSPMT